MKRRLLTLAFVAVLIAAPSKAYYHYVHYLTRTAPFTPLYEKFDLTRLTNNTVSLLVSDSGPTNFGPNDSFGSVLSQVKQAINAWNTVDSSDLRLAFGGLENENQPSNTPGIDVTFTDLPPGIFGLTLVTASQTATNGFFPITRSNVMLTRDTGRSPGPSYLQSYFTTAVHEIGHALGLQHTFTSSAMTQSIVRHTSRVRPLTADDSAGLSVLYGKAGWSANLGSISGRVTATNGTGITLASVVAIAPNGPAVSTLTHPDGTYRIDGLQPGTYLLYVHPLPPDADIKLPRDPGGAVIPQNIPYFQSQFSPGTLDVVAAQNAAITITPGAAVQNRNFSVPQRNSVPTYDVITYSRFDPATRNITRDGEVRTDPAFISSNQSQGVITVQAWPPAPTPTPQSATLLGGFGNSFFIAPFDGAVALWFNTPLLPVSGPRHLVMNFGTDMYVLPDAVTVVQKGVPVINNIASNPDNSATITGAGLGLDTQIFFDGLPATVTVPFSGTDARGTVTVVPPPGASGQVATVTAYNSDGQNSMLLQAQNPPTYTYDSASSPQVNISQTALPAGIGNAPFSALIEVNTSTMKFVDGQVTLGLGTDDIAVRRVWVVNPTRLLANVLVSPNAQTGGSQMTVISGFQIAQAGTFQILPPNSRLPQISLPITNAAQGQQTIYPGAFVSLYGSNLAQSPFAVQLTLNDQPVTPSFAAASQINFQIPGGFATGPAILKLNNGLESVSVVVDIANQPPVIQSVTNNTSNLALDSTRPAGAGDVLTVNLTGLDPSVLGNPSRVRVTIAGVEVPVLSLTSSSIQIIVNQSFGGSPVPLAVIVDGSSSAPFSVIVR